ncbi:MAG TPA: hypothetical protein VLL52_18845 [Anaerolineae bacterium]|nr:hypothetical protein [Anaerolineae bacterium]
MSFRTKRKLVAICPECESSVHFQKEPDLGELIDCPKCEEHLVVIELSPLELDWADDVISEYADDWDDNDNDYDDDYDDDDDYYDDDYDDD